MSGGTFEVNLLDGTTRRGADSEWSCPCGQPVDISSEAAFPVTGGVRLDCTGCGRHYFLSGGVPVIGERGVHEITLPAQ